MALRSIEIRSLCYRRQDKKTCNVYMSIAETERVCAVSLSDQRPAVGEGGGGGGGPSVRTGG